MRIVLSTIHCSPNFTPLALLYLKAYLVEARDWPLTDIPIVEFGPKSSEEEVLNKLVAEKPDVLGFSCYVWNIVSVLAVCEKIKARCPEIKVVLGGPEVGPRAASLLAANRFLDVVVKSEGEIVFGEIVECFKANEKLKSVTGICYRDQDQVIENANAPILSDLNRLPSPHKPEYGDFKGRTVCIETQRGCVFRCNYCFYNKDLSIRNRRFDLDRVKAEMSYWLEQDIRALYLMDPIFNLHAARAKDLLSFIVATNKRRIPFHTEIWAEFVDEEQARLFREAGFKFLEVGLQTTDRKVLAAIERRLHLEEFIRGAELLRKNNLRFELHLIFGLPGETLSSFKEALNFAYSLHPSQISVFPLMILPGTELWRKADSLGLKYESSPPYRILETPTFSRETIAYGRRISEAIHILTTRKIFSKLQEAVGFSLSQMLDGWLEWLDRDPDRAFTPSNLNNLIRRYVTEFCFIRNLDVEHLVETHIGG